MNDVPKYNFLYVSECGLTRDVLKKLPKDMLWTMEPNYCGLCDIAFDNFVSCKYTQHILGTVNIIIILFDESC